MVVDGDDTGEHTQIEKVVVELSCVEGPTIQAKDTGTGRGKCYGADPCVS